MNRRILYFEQITDDRFEDDIYNLLVKRVEKIKELLDIEGIEIYTKYRYFDFGTNKQCRCEFYIHKHTKKITWNDIYKIVNSVNPVSYRFKL